MVGFTTSVSGLVAAQNQLNAGASNIANQSSTSQIVNGQQVNQPFQPLEVVNTTQADGSVSSTIQPDGSQPLLQFDPTSELANEQGLVALPNVDLGSEIVNQILASQQFLSNLSVIERQDDALGSLLDIVE